MGLLDWSNVGGLELGFEDAESVDWGPGQRSPVTAGRVKQADMCEGGCADVTCSSQVAPRSPVTTCPAGRYGHGLSLLLPHQGPGPSLSAPCSSLLPAAGLWACIQKNTRSPAWGAHSNLVISAPRESPLPKRPGRILRCTWTSRLGTSQPAASRCSCVQMSSP